MKSIAVGTLLVGLLSVASSANAQVANTQTDGRDYEVLAYLPKDTLAAIAYFREVSTASVPSYSQSLGVMRASYVLKFGNLSVVPFDVSLPIVDLTVTAPYPDPMLPGLTTTIHTSGLGDATYLPTLAYTISEDEATQTHTVIAATAYVTAPTGQYSSSQQVNLGDNRWRIQPNLAVAQRFLKKMTFEVVGGLAFYTANNSFFVSNAGGMGDVKLTQNQTFGLDAHLTADLTSDLYVGLSYYLASIGERDVTVAAAAPAPAIPAWTVQTVRFTFGIRAEKSTLLLLQYNQDIEESGGAPITRFIGARLSHAVFF